MKKVFDGYMLVTDMDGTILNSDRLVSDKDKEAIRYFKDNAGVFTVATGRNLFAVESYLNQLQINAPAIIDNGAKIYDFDTNETLYEKFLEPWRKEAIKRFHEDYPDIGIEIYVDDRAYIYQKSAWSDRFKKKGYPYEFGVPDDVWEKPWIKVLIIDNKDKIDFCMPIYKTYDSGYTARSGTHLFDIVPSEASKGKATLKLAEMLGIKNDKIITVGDNMNDLPMIECVKFGFSVDNAYDKIKEASAYHAPSNNDNPISFIIQKMEEML